LKIRKLVHVIEGSCGISQCESLKGSLLKKLKLFRSSGGSVEPAGKEARRLICL
jgi:hypothetical protein